MPTGQLRLLLVLAFLLLVLFLQHDNVLTTGLLDDGLLPEKARHKRERERERPVLSVHEERGGRVASSGREAYLWMAGLVPPKDKKDLKK